MWVSPSLLSRKICFGLSFLIFTMGILPHSCHIFRMSSQLSFILWPLAQMPSFFSSIEKIFIEIYLTYNIVWIPHGRHVNLILFYIVASWLDQMRGAKMEVTGNPSSLYIPDFILCLLAQWFQEQGSCLLNSLLRLLYWHRARHLIDAKPVFAEWVNERVVIDTQHVGASQVTLMIFQCHWHWTHTLHLLILNPWGRTGWTWNSYGLNCPSQEKNVVW